MKQYLLFSVFVIFTLTIKMSFGQYNPADTLKLNEVVITGSKEAQPIGNVTQQIDVLTSLDLKPMIQGNNNIAEALMYQPGLSVSALSRNDANWGTYGGIGPNYSTYMLSGLPVDAFIDPMALELQVVDRIELERGPASVLYPNYLSQDFAGNQSPLAGTVNMILKERIDEQKIVASTSYGSYNTFNGQLFLQNALKKFNYYAGINYEMSDYTNYGTDNSWLNMQDNPQYRKTKIYAGATLFSGKSDQNKLSVFFNKTFHNGDAGRVYRGFDNNYTTLNISYSAALSQKINLNTSFGIRGYERAWQESNFNVVDSLLSENGVNQLIVPTDINLTINHGKANLLTVGTDYQSADYETWSTPVNSYEQYGNKSNALQIGIYAQEELHFGGLVLRGGLRYNFTKNNIEMISGGAPGQSEESWNKLLWSGGLKYNFAKIASVFANAGNSFLVPGLKSTGGTIALSDWGVPGRNGQLPNPDLVPESGLGIDAGANFYLPASITASVRGFLIMIDDAIVETVVSENPSQTQSVNAGNSSSVGFEVELGQSLNKLLNWFANFTYMNTNIQNDINENQNDVNVPFAPEFVANTGVNLNFPFGLGFSPYLNYNGGYYDSNSASSRTKFTPGALLNVFVSQTILQNDDFNLEAFGKFYNVTNNQYELPWQFQNPGFSMMLGITMTFN